MNDIPLMIFLFMASVLCTVASIALAFLFILGGFGVNQQDFVVVSMAAVLMAVMAKATSLRETEELY